MSFPFFERQSIILLIFTLAIIYLDLTKSQQILKDRKNLSIGNEDLIRGIRSVDAGEVSKNLKNEDLRRVRKVGEIVLDEKIEDSKNEKPFERSPTVSNRRKRNSEKNGTSEVFRNENEHKSKNNSEAAAVVPSRRFLFGPSITNTINNLNQNTNSNTNVIHHPPGMKDQLGKTAYQKYRQNLIPYSYLKRNSSPGRLGEKKFPGMEYDLRGTGFTLISTHDTSLTQKLQTEIMQRSEYLNNLLSGHHSRRFHNENSNPAVIILDPNSLEEARRTISHMSPEARRFLFSPTIQNTITNLNQNTNTQEMQFGRGGEDDAEVSERNSEQILGYVDPKSGAVEYDLKGKVNKVCFLLD